MALATATRDGVPAVRTVLLKDVNESGFVFFTSYASPKARDLADNPVASLLFFWAALERQVRVSGSVNRVPRELSEEYFASRPTTSQWAAWASTQSAPLPDRAALEAQFEQIKRRFGEAPAPCPPEWGGYALAPQHIEFWQGRSSRLHDRLLYTKRADGTWSRTRLSP
jgi:pyridoxamine 5'-phosphate oxidase